VRRREFIALVSGAAVTWPHSVHAQQGHRLRVLGVLMHTAESDSDGQARIAALREVLGNLGWTEGRGIKIVDRWGASDIERVQQYAADLVALEPDVIFVYANAQLAALSQRTRTIPIVFVGASDPVGAGYVSSFARPGGNITGFTLYEPSLVGKWLDILKELAPTMKRVALMTNPDTATLRGRFYTDGSNAAAATIGVQPITAYVHNDRDIEVAIASFGRQSNSGLVVAPDTFTDAHMEPITGFAMKNHVPAIYGHRHFPVRGGLISYGPDTVEVVRRAAAYVNRILHGEKPADLPIQTPTKFEFVINLKTAKALGLTVSASLLARVDEVIE
jgi:putative ABC transport system substrate-binding protein